MIELPEIVMKAASPPKEKLAKVQPINSSILAIDDSSPTRRQTVHDPKKEEEKSSKPTHIRFNSKVGVEVVAAAAGSSSEDSGGKNAGTATKLKGPGTGRVMNP
mmetsp:Transcript_21808/g.33733  ORF Transcript_21808/g.33733 Transcript_21808/m.33733 type:complete len:104 (+) Transcript_21808:2332-2643(+)|eukprot:CAMPEP_0170494610 /NCGR_PEP_ID=MMETSP0208-20121228/14739_1 /TAXON_ID=197538 /ORGANISM="Strombidium inclinatum, Strain S3" /LENGTH=103 /DNA_ID=CAMNT_0010770693 /DNA_START=2332 /DNA_END=2643 /DNA_ORIENTATION=-